MGAYNTQKRFLSCMLVVSGRRLLPGSDFPGAVSSSDTQIMTMECERDATPPVRAAASSGSCVAVVDASGALGVLGSGFYGEGLHAAKDAREGRLTYPPWPHGPLACVGLGGAFAMALAYDGAVLSWGHCGTEGQLGRADTDDAAPPGPGAVACLPPCRLAFPPAAARVLNLACGQQHTLFVTETGQVYCCGAGHLGQLGTGMLTPSTLPILAALPPSATAVSVAAGWCHSACVTTDGRLFTWGWGLYSQLGHGDISNQATPKEVEALRDVGSGLPGEKDVVAVACGAWHTVALAGNGDVYTCGWGKHGQLGHEYGAPTVGVSGTESLEDICREHVPRLVEALSAHIIVQVAAGSKHSAALTKGGEVLSWGAACCYDGTELKDCTPLPARLSIPCPAVGLWAGAGVTLVATTPKPS